MNIHKYLKAFTNAIINHTRRLFVPYLIRRSAQKYPNITSNVIRLTRGSILKRGHAIYLRLEAEATRYVALHTSIPVPTIHDFWTEEDGRACLVMEYKDGQTLHRHWRHLSVDQKMTIMRVLRGFLDELRSLPQPHPKGMIGSVSGGAFFDFRMSGQSLYGPFRDEAAYNDWRISTFGFLGDQHPPTKLRLRQLRDEMRNDHQITFTHGDITRRNILIRVDGEGANDVSVVAILDWEQAGWRPEYWETAKFMFGNQDTCEWAILGRQETFLGYDLELEREDELSLLYGGSP
jgi:aminoglycoside phosphotransferase (APT) family kinase protein